MRQILFTVNSTRLPAVAEPAGNGTTSLAVKFTGAPGTVKAQVVHGPGPKNARFANGEGPCKSGVVIMLGDVAYTVRKRLADDWIVWRVQVDGQPKPTDQHEIYDHRDCYFLGLPKLTDKTSKINGLRDL